MKVCCVLFWRTLRRLSRELISGVCRRVCGQGRSLWPMALLSLCVPRYFWEGGTHLFTLTLSLTHTHTHEHTHTHTYIHTLKHTFSHTHSLTHSLTHTLSHSPTRSLRLFVGSLCLCSIPRPQKAPSPNRSGVALQRRWMRVSDISKKHALLYCDTFSI